MNYRTAAEAEISRPADAEFAPSPKEATLVIPSVGVWTTQALIDNCAAWRPDLAAKQRDSALCVSEVICAVNVNGTIKELQLVNARWASIYIRVSTEAQRSGKSNRSVADGFSELHQLRSCIEWCIFHGYAFKIYSDAGITSSYPPDNGRLIRGLLKAKAERYRKAFDRVWLGDSTKANYPPEQVVSMTQYRDAMVTKIKTGPFTDGSDEVGAGDRRNSKVYHRQALTQLWRDMDCQSTHLVVVTDKSRLFRSADLEMLFYELAHESRVGIKGTEESILTFDISEPEQKGTLYLLASFNEKKLYDSLYNSLKGVAESILSGKPHAKLPFWLRRDESGNAVIIQDNVPLVHRIIELCFEDVGGPGAISAKLFAEGKRTAEGRQVTAQMVRGVLEDDSIAGIHRHFGWGWPTLPPVIDDESFRELRLHLETKKVSAAKIAIAGGPRVRAHRRFRSVAVCDCGLPLQHQDDYNEFEATGNLVCHRRDRADKRRRRHTHTYFPEAVLANWMAEIMPSIGHLIEHIGPAEDRARQRLALRHVLEQKVIDAEAICSNRKAEAIDKARNNALILGLEPKSSNFEQTVVAIADAMVAHETNGLSDLRNQLETLEKAAQSERADVRQRAHLTEVERWSELNEKSQNLILRAIFDKIVISPSPFLASQKKALLEGGADADVIDQGTITFHLNGVADPLPPVKMFRGGHSGRAVCLQHPTDWLAEMFGIERPLTPNLGSSSSTPAICKINSRMRVSFFAYMRRYTSCDDADAASDPVSYLASAIRKDKGQPRARLTVKSAVKDYLIARGFAPEVIAALDSAWSKYLESERSRIIPLLAPVHGTEAVSAAWSAFMSTQE